MHRKIENEKYTPPRSGLIILQIAVAFLFILLCTRFWYLQIHKGDTFSNLAQANRFRYIENFAIRGEIHDRNGILLAEDHIVFSLSIVREDCPDVEAALTQISYWTDVPYKTLLMRYNNAKGHVKYFDPIYVANGLSFDAIAPIQAELSSWPGIHIVARPRRYYPERENFAHVLGYVAEAKPEEIEKDDSLDLGDTVGRQGIERVFESTLRGEKARYRTEVDVVGRVLEQDVLKQSRAGADVVLSLDARLQKGIIDIMDDHAGTVVVMDADTGKVHALVTLPSYDNNLFITGFSVKEWNTLRDNPLFPLQNRSIQSVFPPGSVWKLMMAAMFLEKDVDPKKTVFCGGEYKLGNQTFRCWKRGGHGKVDMRRSLTESCDIYYYELANEIGIDAIESYARAFGYGSKTGIDLPHENSGLVPSREWKASRRGSTWKGGDTINVSIGQGFTLVTPLQMAVSIAALVNGGNVLKPQVLMDAPTEVLSTLPVSQETRELVCKYMVDTVTDKRGTAKALKRDDLEVGGKTGTAQVVKIRMKGKNRIKSEEMLYYERDHAWIGTWGRREGKTYVVVVMVEHGGGGSSVAGPVAREVYELLFEKR